MGHQTAEPPRSGRRAGCHSSARADNNADDEIKRAYGALSNPGGRELLGNLALVTVRDNSKFTNNPPFLKAQASRVVAQSPKLGKMAEVAERDHRAWDSAAIHAHHKEMLDLLRKDLFVSD